MSKIVDIVGINRGDPQLEQKLGSIIEDDANVVFQSFPPEKTRKFLLEEIKTTANKIPNEGLKTLVNSGVPKVVENHLDEVKEKRKVVERVTDKPILYLENDISAYVEARKSGMADREGIDLYLETGSLPELGERNSFAFLELFTYSSDDGYDIIHGNESISTSEAAEKVLLHGWDYEEAENVGITIQDQIPDWNKYRQLLDETRMPEWQERYSEWEEKIEEVGSKTDYLVLGLGHAVDTENSFYRILKEENQDLIDERINLNQTNHPKEPIYDLKMPLN